MGHHLRRLPKSARTLSALSLGFGMLIHSWTFGEGLQTAEAQPRRFSQIGFDRADPNEAPKAAAKKSNATKVQRSASPQLGLETKVHSENKVRSENKGPATGERLRFLNTEDLLKEAQQGKAKGNALTADELGTEE